MIELTLHDYDAIDLEIADSHCSPDAINNHFSVVTFKKEGKAILRVNLHYDDNCRNSIVIASHFKRPARSDRGPYLMPNEDGSYDEFPDDVYLDWHYEQPDHMICIDMVHNMYGDVLASDDFTDEMHEALVTQIYEYLEKQPAPYTGD